MSEERAACSARDQQDRGVDRRRFLAGAVVTAGAAWAAPAIVSSHDIAWAAGTVAGEHYGGNHQVSYELPKNRTVQFVLVGGGGGSGQNTWNVNNAGEVSRRVQEGAGGSDRIRQIDPGNGKAGRGGAGTRLIGTFDTGSEPMTIRVWTGAAGQNAPRLNTGPRAGDGTRGGKGGPGYTNGGNGGVGLYQTGSNLWNLGDVYLSGDAGFFELYGGCGGGGGGSSAIWSVGTPDQPDDRLEIIAPGGGGGGGAGSAYEGSGSSIRPRDWNRSSGNGYRISSGGGHGGDGVAALGSQYTDVNGSSGQAGTAGRTADGSSASGAGAGGAGGATGSGGGGNGANATTANEGYVGGAGGGGGGGGVGGGGGGAGTPVGGSGNSRATPGGGGGGSGSMRIHGANTPVEVVNQGGDDPGPPDNSGSLEERAGQWGPRDTSVGASQVPAQGWDGNPGYYSIYLV